MTIRSKIRGIVRKVAPTHPYSILVIEDNGSDVFLLKRALSLQHIDFELTHLRDGREALAFVHRQAPYKQGPRPDLILVDLNLPKVDGQEVMRQIRSAKHLKGVPACVWSSSESVLDRTLLGRLGASEMIFKPSGLASFMQIGKILKDVLSEKFPAVAPATS
jgi:CheY-like chemotaxis protein